MVRHAPFGHFVAHRERQEDFRWNTFHSQNRILLKTETPIEGWIADQDATLCPQVPNGPQSIVDECLTDALSLMAWGNGNRPERKPLPILAVDGNQREGDLADDIAIDFGDE